MGVQDPTQPARDWVGAGPLLGLGAYCLSVFCAALPGTPGWREQAWGAFSFWQAPPGLPWVLRLQPWSGACGAEGKPGGLSVVCRTPRFPASMPAFFLRLLLVLRVVPRTLVALGEGTGDVAYPTGVLSLPPVYSPGMQTTGEHFWGTSPLEEVTAS